MIMTRVLDQHFQFLQLSVVTVHTELSTATKSNCSHLIRNIVTNGENTQSIKIIKIKYGVAFMNLTLMNRCKRIPAKSPVAVT